MALFFRTALHATPNVASREHSTLMTAADGKLFVGHISNYLGKALIRTRTLAVSKLGLQPSVDHVRSGTACMP